MSCLRLCRAALLVATLAASPILAQTDLLASGTWSFSGADGARRETVPADDQPGGFATAFRITTPTASPDTPWRVQLSHVVPTILLRNQVLRLRFWARSPEGATIGPLLERNGDPYEKSLLMEVPLRPEWAEYAVAFAALPYPANGAAVRFRLALTPGTVELAGVRLEDYGVDPAAWPETYGFRAYERPANDAWREAARERIRLHRMGTLRVKVVDANGSPVPGAVVTVRQLRHHFGFGSALADGPLLAQTPDGERYRTEVRRLFNYVVLENALKWSFRDGAGLPTAERMLTWLEENSIPVRGHTLFWPSYRHLPSALRPLRGQAMRDAVEAHVREFAGRARGRVVVWDVVNEVVTNREILDEAGRDLFWKAYQWAREADPNVALAYNDYNLSNHADGRNDGHRARVLAAIRELQANGAPLNVIGDQGHMSLPLTRPERLLTIWDEVAQFGLPVEITEFDIGFGGLRDEEAQAQYLEDYLTAAFSHPGIHSFVMWGFWDGAHWRSSEGAGLFRRDWSPRPMLGVYERLVFGEWWTQERGETAADGAVAVRAYLGTHEVTVTSPDGRQVVQKVAVTDGGEAVRDVVVTLQ